jgi:hypothetical protein
LQDRVFIANQAIRTLLHRFACGSQLYHGKKIVALTKEEKANMMQRLEVVCRPLHGFINVIAKDNVEAPEYSKKLFMSLASSSSVCAYIPPCDIVHNILIAYINGENIRQDPNRWQILSDKVPVLVDILLHSSSDEDFEVPIVLKELLNVLLQKAFAPFLPDCHVGDCNASACDDELACFPALPLVRGRGKYAADVKGHGKKELCGKHYVGHPILLPGIFTIFCEHGTYL